MLPAAFDINDTSPLDPGDGVQFVRRPDNVASDNDAVSVAAAAAAARSNSASFSNGKGSFGVVGGGGEKKSKHAEASDVHVGPTTLSATRLARLRVAAQEEKAQRQPWRSTEKSSLQRPKPPKASHSFRQILAANKATTPSSENVVAPFCVDDEKDAKSVVRTTTSPRSHAASALKSPLNTREFSPEPIPESSFSPSSSEFASVKRTNSVSSIGSGSAGRLRGLTSSFLRRLRGTSVKRFEDEGGGGGGGKVTPSKALAQTHIDQRGKRITTSTQLVASLIDHERSRGLYKESSDASVTSFHGTTEEEGESVESIAGADTPSSFDQASSTSVQPRLSDSSLSLRSSSGARGLVHKSSTDLPVIQGSPPDERPPPKRTVARAQQRSDKLRDRRTHSHDSQRTPLASDHGHGMPSTMTTTNDRAGNGGGGWRSRFGSSRRSEKAADVQSITSEANVQQREAAVQHISRQQRSAKGIKDRTKAESMPGSPHSRLDAYRKATGVVAAAATAAATTSGPALSKAERMMGSGAFAVVQEDVTKTHREFNASGGNKDDADCPVCLEPLSFRLAGEKKHVVPQCGHALHHACFTAVYGAPELVHAAQASGKRNAAPGMCGVCRKLIVLPAIEQGPTDDVGAKGKAKSMMGLSNADRRESEEDFKGNWQIGRSAAGENGGGADDPVHGNAYDHRSAAAAAASSTHKGVQGTLSIAKTDADRSSDSSMVLPIVHVRPEFETIVRTKRPSNRTNGGETQNVVCVVSVQVPPRRRRLRMEEDEQLWRQKCDQYSLLAAAAAEKKSSGQVGNQDDEIEGYVDDERPETEPAEITEKIEPSSPSSASSEEEGFSYGATPAATSNKTSFRVAIDDLKNRVIDWKGHSVDKFGELIVFDFLGVRQDTVMREFHVYLFREALLCVSEERKKERGLVRLINATTSSSQDDTSSGSSTSRTGKTAMKLKGRIWIRHIRHCQELDVDGSPCLSIRLDDEALDHFVLCFKEHGMRKSWKSKLTRVLKDRQAAAAAAAAATTTGARPSKDKVAGGDEASLNLRRDTMNELPSPAPAAAAAISKDGSYGSLTTSSSVKQTAGGGGGGTMPSSDSKSTTLNSPTTSSVHASPSSVIAAAAHGQPKGLRNRPSVATMPDFLTNLPQHQQWSASGGLDPSKPVPSMLPHTPLDLIVMVSVPSVTVQPAVSSTTISSSAALKLRLIRSTLDFVIANVGARDRIALVAYNVGNGGAIRRTALLNANKTASRERLELFVESIGKPWEGPGEDPFEESFDDVGGMGERTDTVTAINVGFDIALQRKTKNPTTSMLLINDTADAPKRGQMDLIMARGEAANVPVHCFGFGKSHDPSSLWLISNHTRGSYTFVKEWYQLRECVAGCLGALMSIALTDVKIHVCVPSDNHFRVRRVTGCTGTIVSSSGKDVDLTIGELRFGETKELLLELELDFGALLAEREANRERAVTALGANGFEHGSATDDFMQRLGLEGLSIAEARQRPINVKRMFYKNSTNGSELDAEHGVQKGEDEGLDEVAVLEVHCGCRDPHVGMTKHQIGDPCVLTMEVDCSGNIKEDEDDRMSTVMADPTVTRRRLEILVSDMITRSLLLVSRGNNAQALQILLETRKIVDTVLRTVPLQAFEEDSNKARRSSLVAFQTQAALYATQTRNSHARKQRQLLHRRTALSLIAITEDLDVLIDGLEMSKAVSFERSERNFGAQQAMVLRDQKAWTSRSDTEWLFYSMLDNGPTFAALAAQHAARYSL